jgi:hypothetical protein
MNYEESLKLVVNAKERYRSVSRSMTWEQKVASIEQMREAARKAREAMKAAQTRELEGNRDHR